MDQHDRNLEDRIRPIQEAFEKSWDAGEQPQIGAFLADWRDPDRGRLFSSLLELEVKLHRESGSKFALERYRSVFPEYEYLVNQVDMRDVNLAENDDDLALPEFGDSSVDNLPRDDVAEDSVVEDLVIEESVAEETGDNHQAEQDSGGDHHTIIQSDQTLANLTNPAPIAQTGTFEPEDRVTPSDETKSPSTIQHLRRKRREVPVRIPEKIGRYEILEVLGKGGMGVVYLASDSQLDRRVALKVPSMAAIKGTDGLNRFIREARSLAAIVHPNICPIHEVGEADHHHYITMTYVEGRPLSTYISDGLPINDAIMIVRKLASALQHAHTAGVIHRDLKPSNVIINNLNEPVIIDFGLARRADAPELELTQVGQVMGTPAYMPPEQFTNEDIGPACDIYSLGVMLYELLTSRKPFTGSFPAIVLKIDSEKAEPPSTQRAGIDADLDAICLKCLQKLPEDRFSSMEDFAQVLTGFLERDEKPDPSSTTRNPVQPGATIAVGDKSDTGGLPSGQINHIGDDDKTVVPVSEGYRLTERLGTGAYGEVWKAMAPGDVEVAVKKILFPVGHNATQVELRALELMKRLRHSFLIQVQAYWVMQEQLMIVMELADASLEERARECRRTLDSGIPQEELLSYMREAAEAIDFLHSENVLHRDIKPANILLVKGHVKVADFGIAMAGVMGDDLTTTATTLGTPLYMAPELWQKRAGPGSDQYSLAISYYELRIGKDLEFGSGHKLDLSGLETSEREIVRRAISPDPKDRFESCSAFISALDELKVIERLAIEKQQRRRRFQIATLALFVIMLPVGWWIWTHPFYAETQPDFTIPDTILVRAGGEASTISLATVGDWGAEPLDLTLERIPPGVQFSWRPIEGGAEIKLDAKLQTEPDEFDVTLVTTNGDTTVRQDVVLAIEEAEFIMPRGCRPAAGAQLVAVADKVYYDRIEYGLSEQTAIEFLLIPRTQGSDPATFYFMRNMVSNGLFAAFVKLSEKDGQIDDRWSRGARAGTSWLSAEDFPELPVLSVTVDDAHAFAEWLGGKLPTSRQWDKAAGRWDHDTEVGPFQGKWEGSSGAIAVNRLSEGPLPVGTADKDISPWGCRDMSGNGREWTRSIHLSQQEVPLEQPGALDLVITRGRAYDHPEPLLYLDLEDETQIETTLYRDDRLPGVGADLGFRCVIEP